MDLTPLGCFFMVLTQDVAWILWSVFVCHQQLLWGCRWRTTHTDSHMKEIYLGHGSFVTSWLHSVLVLYMNDQTCLWWEQGM